jgi:hypothetical protein
LAGKSGKVRELQQPTDKKFLNARVITTNSLKIEEMASSKRLTCAQLGVAGFDRGLSFRLELRA